MTGVIADPRAGGVHMAENTLICTLVVTREGSSIWPLTIRVDSGPLHVDLGVVADGREGEPAVVE